MEVSVSTGYGYENCVSRKERKMDEKIFKDAQRAVRRSEVRNADWGLYAAQNCLARDLVNATPDEMGLIIDKMNFIQSHMNSNLQLDNSLYCDKIHAKSDASNSRAQVIKASADATSNVVKSAADLVHTVKTTNSPGKVLNIAA